MGDGNPGNSGSSNRGPQELTGRDSKTCPVSRKVNALICGLSHCQRIATVAGEGPGAASCALAGSASKAASRPATIRSTINTKPSP